MYPMFKQNTPATRYGGKGSEKLGKAGRKWQGKLGQCWLGQVRAG